MDADTYRLLTPKEAGEFIGLSPDTIKITMKTGNLKHKKIGTHYRTTKRWLEEWIDYVEPMPKSYHDNKAKKEPLTQADVLTFARSFK